MLCPPFEALVMPDGAKNRQMTITDTILMNYNHVWNVWMKLNKLIISNKKIPVKKSATSFYVFVHVIIN